MNGEVGGVSRPVLAEILNPVHESGGKAYLQDVYRFVCTERGRTSEELWTGLNALSAGGILTGYDEEGRTVLELGEEDYTAEDIPRQESRSRSEGEWADLYLKREWKDAGPVRLPGLDARLLEDFFRRDSGYDEDDYRRWNAGKTTAVAGYSDVRDGEKEYWTVAVNDRGEEEDRLALMVRFNRETGVFQPRHRHSYATELWTPVMALQQRNSMVNEAVEEAVSTVLPELEGDTVEKALVSKLETLGRVEGGYEEARDAAVSNYFGDFSGSKLLTPFSKRFELDANDAELLRSGVDRDEVTGSKLPVYGEGREKNRVNVEVYLDRLYEAAKNMD